MSLSGFIRSKNKLQRMCWKEKEDCQTKAASTVLTGKSGRVTEDRAGTQ